jgi:hypothetical protein
MVVHKKRIEFYKPKAKKGIHKEEAFPYLVDVGARFATLGGMTGFFLSSFIASFKTFRDAKKKFRGLKSKYERTLDLRD